MSSEDRPTPPGIPPTQWRLHELERAMRLDHDRLRALEEAHLIAIGRDGRGGRLHDTHTRINEIDIRVSHNEKALIHMDKQQAVAQLKIAAIVAVMSAIGGLLSAIVLRAVFGG